MNDLKTGNKIIEYVTQNTRFENRSTYCSLAPAACLIIEFSACVHSLQRWRYRVNYLVSGISASGK